MWAAQCRAVMPSIWGWFMSTWRAIKARTDRDRVLASASGDSAAVTVQFTRRKMIHVER